MSFLRFVLLALAVVGVSLSGRAGAQVTDVSLVVPLGSASPVRFGAVELERALADKGYRVTRTTDVRATTTGRRILLLDASYTEDRQGLETLGSLKERIPSHPESFLNIAIDPDLVIVAGRTAVGTLYGTLELAETFETLSVPADPLQVITAKRAEPAYDWRGVSGFLQVQAFEDQNSWFYDTDFWETYLTILARSRINFLNLQGAYDLETGTFRNLLLYFYSGSSRLSGETSPDEAERNRGALSRLVSQAHRKGIRVGLTTRSLAMDGSFTPESTSWVTGTLNAVREILQDSGGLEGIGFSLDPEIRTTLPYEETFLKALRDVEPKPVLILRPAGGDRGMIENLADAYGHRTLVELNFNGGQLVAPYQVMGGRFAGGRGISFEDHGRLPRNYEVIWSIGANGTHRVFRWGDPDFVHRVVRACSLIGATGITVEPMTARSPATDFLSNPIHISQGYYRWLMERDWFWYQLWGRLSYDPNIPRRVWENQFARRFGPMAAAAAFRTLTRMSQVVPLMALAHAPGLDERTMAPELELGDQGKGLSGYVEVLPFDAVRVQSHLERAGEIAYGTRTGKLSGPELMRMFRTSAESALGSADQIPLGALTNMSARRELMEIKVHAQAVSHLSRYHEARTKAAISLRLFETFQDGRDLAEACAGAREALAAWEDLTNLTDRWFQPFADPLTMGTLQFHWRNEKPILEEETVGLEVRYSDHVAVVRSAETGLSPSEAGRVTDAFDEGFEEGIAAGWSPWRKDRGVVEWNERRTDETAAQELATNSGRFGVVRAFRLMASQAYRVAVSFTVQDYEGKARPGGKVQVGFDPTGQITRPDAESVSWWDLTQAADFEAETASLHRYETDVLVSPESVLSVWLEVSAQGEPGVRAAFERVEMVPKPSALWLEITSPEFPACKIGHRPTQRAPAGQAIRITATPYTREHLDSLSLVYQTVGAATGREIPMSRRESEACYEADIRAEDVVDGTLAYRIHARTDTQEISVPEDSWQIIRVASDNVPPVIEPLDPTTPEGPMSDFPIRLLVLDDSTVAQVQILYKPIDSRERFRALAMTAVGSGVYSAQIPVTPEGILYFVRAVDEHANSATYPDLVSEKPYYVVPGWDPTVPWGTVD